MKASRGEIKIHEILTQYNIPFQEEYEFAGLKTPSGRPLRQRFDFAVFDDDGELDFLIEFQGKQHYQAVSKFGGVRGLYQQQFNDKKKRRFCALKGIKLLEIPYQDESLLNYDYIFSRVNS